MPWKAVAGRIRTAFDQGGEPSTASSVEPLVGLSRWHAPGSRNLARHATNSVRLSRSTWRSGGSRPLRWACRILDQTDIERRGLDCLHRGDVNRGPEGHRILPQPKASDLHHGQVRDTQGNGRHAAPTLPDLPADAGIRLKSMRAGSTQHVVCPRSEGGRTRDSSLAVSIDPEGDGAVRACHWDFFGERQIAGRARSSVRRLRHAPLVSRADPPHRHDRVPLRRTTAAASDKPPSASGRDQGVNSVGEFLCGHNDLQPAITHHP